MNARSDRRTFLGIAKLVGLAFFSPLIASCYGVGKVVLGQQGAKRRLFVLSVSANLLFGLFLLLVFIVGYTDEHEGEGEQLKGEVAGRLVAAHCSQRPQGPLVFCEAVSGSELARLAPNTIYVASEGLIRARFEFDSQDLEALTEVSISDRHGRLWIDVDLVDGTMIYSRYTDDLRIEPNMGMMDRDGDGIPDTMMNWDTETRFEPVREFVWRPVNHVRGEDN